MSGIIPEELDELRRQIEEDYRIDMAALEHLLRRFSEATASQPAPADVPVSNGAQLGRSKVKSARPGAPAVASGAPEQQPDEVDGSLRAMFRNPPKTKGAS